MWDVLSNKEAVDIVSSAPGRGTAARALVDCATRAWRLKYPTSKNDDCAVVCLFLENVPQTLDDPAPVPQEVPEEEEENKVPLKAENQDMEYCGGAFIMMGSETSEIVPVVEEVENKAMDKSLGQSKRSLAECLSTAEDDEWSALEGITRVNSLLSLPRFLPFDRRSTSWRKWL